MAVSSKCQTLFFHKQTPKVLTLSFLRHVSMQIGRKTYYSVLTFIIMFKFRILKTILILCENDPWIWSHFLCVCFKNWLDKTIITWMELITHQPAVWNLKRDLLASKNYYRNYPSIVKKVEVLHIKTFPMSTTSYYSTPPK